MRLPTATGATMSCTRGRTTSSASPALGSLRRARPNGSVTDDRERTDPVAAASTGRDAVRGAGDRPGRERRDEEARRAPALVEPVGGGEQGSGPAAQVLDQEVDAALGCRRGGGPGRTRRLTASSGGVWSRSHSATAITSTNAAIPSTSISSAPRRKLPTTSPIAAPGERPAASGQGDGAASSRARWAGPRWPRRESQPPPAPGTGTDVMIERTTSLAETPRSWASGARIIRCSSTEGSTRFTSSGIT